MKNNQKIKSNKLIRRKKKVRAKIYGTKERPRLCVSRSLKHLYVQLIDDDSGTTIAAAHDTELPGKKKNQPKSEKASQLGQVIAKKALDKKIKKVVFDRGGRLYHGRIKDLAEGARKGGLQF